MKFFMLGLFVSQFAVAQTLPNNKVKAAASVSLVAAAVTVNQLKSEVLYLKPSATALFRKAEREAVLSQIKNGDDIKILFKESDWFLIRQSEKIKLKSVTKESMEQFLIENGWGDIQSIKKLNGKFYFEFLTPKRIAAVAAIGTVASGAYAISEYNAGKTENLKARFDNSGRVVANKTSGQPKPTLKAAAGKAKGE